MSPPETLQVTITCEWCQKERVIPSTHRGAMPRFCNRSCSAKWRTSQPWAKEMASRVGKASVAKTGGLKTMWQREDFQQIVKERMKTRNPMADPGIVERAAAKKRGRPFPAPRGGNGRGLTRPQALVLGWTTSLVAEFAVGVPKEARMGTEVRRYSIDLADPERKLAIELDGISHRTKMGRARDARKDAILSFLGWQVLRLWNWEVTDSPDETRKRVESFLTSK